MDPISIAMSQLKAGAQLYTVREFTQTIEGVEDALKKVRAIGYTGVQISAFGDVDPQKVARLAEENDLTIVRLPAQRGTGLHRIPAEGNPGHSLHRPPAHAQRISAYIREGGVASAGSTLLSAFAAPVR